VVALAAGAEGGSLLAAWPASAVDVSTAVTAAATGLAPLAADAWLSGVGAVAVVCEALLAPETAVVSAAPDALAGLAAAARVAVRMALLALLAALVALLTAVLATFAAVVLVLVAAAPAALDAEAGGGGAGGAAGGAGGAG
jgi:hypothetical protein